MSSPRHDKHRERRVEDSAPGLRASTNPTLQKWFSLLFGLVLGIALIKFGNPVVLHSAVLPPVAWSEWWQEPWPPGWAAAVILPAAFVAAMLFLQQTKRWPASAWLWILPIFWVAWQVIASTSTVNANLTRLTVWHFASCAACFFIGVLVLGHRMLLRFLLIGLLAGFAFCLVRATNQRIVEFPRDYQFLTESEQQGWTNLPPALFNELKQTQVILSTNGIDVANPVFVEKYRKGRVFGTLVYPNALAGAVLLLFPASIVLVLTGTRRFRVSTRLIAVGLTGFLGVATLFWTGSKSGWLIALAVFVAAFLREQRLGRARWVILALVIGIGGGLFLVRFQNYFAAGASSVGARFDYWRAAAQVVADKPLFGSGPGTFQVPYSQMKAPESEMARLVHNDYLEQFSDSGIPGGLAYAGWIVVLLVTLGKRVWNEADPLPFALFLGLLGWFAQGLSEFSLYVPGLAWPAFTLAGALLGISTGRLYSEPTPSTRPVSPAPDP